MIVMTLGWGVGRVVITFRKHAVTRFTGSCMKPFVIENDDGRPPEVRVSFEVMSRGNR